MAGGEGKKRSNPKTKNDQKKKPKTNGKSKNNNEKSSVSMKNDKSADVVCRLCNESNISEEWVVQCDICDQYCHFRCVGIVEVEELESFICPACYIEEKEKAKLNDQDENKQPSNQLSSNEIPAQNVPIANVEADIHRMPTLEDVEEDDSVVIVNDMNPKVSKDAENVQDPQPTDRIEVQNETNSFRFDVNTQKSSTRAESINVPLKTKSVSVRSKVESIHSRNSNLRQERLEAEFALSEEVDKATIDAMKERLEAEAALELKQIKAKEALKLKEIEMTANRAKKFIIEQTKSNGSQNGSVRSSGSNLTNRTSYVSSWISGLPKIPPQQSQSQPEQTQARPEQIQLQNHQKQSNTDIIQTYEEWKNVQPKYTRLNNPNRNLKTGSVAGNEKKETENYSSEGRKHSRSVDEKVQAFGSKIDNVDWSISMNQSEQRQWTKINDQDQTANKGKSQNLNENVSIFVPNSNAETTFTKSTSNSNPQRKPMLVTKPNPNDQTKTTSSHGNMHSKVHGYDTRNWRGQTQSTQVPITGPSSVKFSRNNNDYQGTFENSQPIPSSNQNYQHEHTNPQHSYGHFSNIENPSFNRTENLDRLERSIQGTARTLVESLLTLPQCVPEIIDILRQKYGRPEIIIRTVLARIKNEPGIKPYQLEALTPNHFLLGSSNGYKAPCMMELDGPYLRQSWKEAQRLTELFWKRFVKEYLPTIARRTKWFKPVKPLQPGDLVLIVDTESPRNSYPKARIVKTQIGSNGQVRRAKVDTILEVETNKKEQICKVRRNELWRPAHKLALFDITPIQEISATQPNESFDVAQMKGIEKAQAVVDPEPAHIPKNGLAQPIDRKTGGNVGAGGLKYSKSKSTAKNRTNLLPSRGLRSSVRK